MGYVESCLWEYKANKGALALLREELAGLKSVHGQELKLHTENGVSDPVSEVAHQVLILEQKISRLEKHTRPVEKLQEYLTSSDERTYHMSEILKLKYFDHKDTDLVIKKIGISEATYFRRCSELKRLARKYILER